MGIEARRSRERSELREKILEAAGRLFATGGYENASMRKIAKEIEYSAATIFNVFTNKKEILQALANRAHEVVSKKFKMINEDDSLSAFEKLQSLIRAYIEFGLSESNIYVLYVDQCELEIKENALYETIAGKRYRIFMSWQSQIEKLMHDGKMDKEDSINAVLRIFWAVDGFIMSSIKQPHLSAINQEDQITALLKMIFWGLFNRGTSHQQ